MGEEKRRAKRIFVFCRVLDNEDNFLGYALDLTQFGIKIMIQSSNKKEEIIDIKMVSPDRENPIIVKGKVRIVWRKQRSEQFDEIGGEFINVDDNENFLKFIEYFKSVADKYSLRI